MTTPPQTDQSKQQIIHGPAILLETGFQEATVVIEDGWIVDIATTRLPSANEIAPGCILSPGLVDVQVNGGGGIMLNDRPTPETIATMIDAHRRLGTTSLLPTLITDAPEKMRQAADSLRAMKDYPGLLGVHFEGPFLSREKPGIHATDHIRPIEQADIDILVALTSDCRDHRIILTLAPENAADAALSALSHAGIILSAGHCAPTPDRLATAFDAGLRGFTHLFNAMPPIESRRPGVVAAALLDDESFCGIIADGVHVDPVALRLAIKCKRPGRLFLVTDAMAPAGTNQQSFQIDTRTIYRRNGRLTDAKGTLAGADLTLPQAIRMVRDLGVDLAEALRMASTYPADFIKCPTLGRIKIGCRADFTLLDERLEPVGTWVAGQWQATCGDAPQSRAHIAMTNQPAN